MARKYVTERVVWDGTKNGATVTKDGKELYERDDSNKAPAVHLGPFQGGKKRRVSGLARYPGDPQAYCSSMDEVQAKCAAQGKRVARVDDYYYDEHHT